MLILFSEFHFICTTFWKINNPVSFPSNQKGKVFYNTE